MTEVPNVLDAFSRVRVLVAGDTMLDVYREGTANRLCREGPVPVVRVRERTDCAGGAANTAVNLRRLGAEVDLMSLVGDDPVARRCGPSSNRSAFGPTSPSRPSGQPRPAADRGRRPAVGPVFAAALLGEVRPEREATGPAQLLGVEQYATSTQATPWRASRSVSGE